MQHIHSHLAKQVDADIIKWYLLDMASSYESYFVLKNNFGRSLAALNICHWILGIGDRHLDNLMLSKTSGKIVGIDFGHVFGYGTREQVVPELVPFRLTPHILHLFQPFGVSGLLFRCMCHTLRCLRYEQDTILSTMAIFVHEPAINWVEEDNEYSYELNQSVWDPKTRIETSRRKLNGANSLMITLAEIKKNRHRQAPMFKDLFVKSYRKHIQACPGYSENENLTVEEQVKVLIDHATEKSLLLLMFSGWASWV